MSDAYIIDDRKARRNVAVLVAAQAVLGSQITMVFVIGSLAGQMLAPAPWLATLPISMVVFGSMTTAPWLSPFMQRHGRVPGFALGATGGLIGSVIAALAVFFGNFWLLLLGSYLTGTYQSAQGFYRFAAADTASDTFRPKAISWVMAGGLLSALIGPQLVKVTEGLTAVPFMGTYLAGAAVTAVGMLLFLFLDLPRPQVSTVTPQPARGWGDLLRTPAILVSVIVGAVSYALMNLVMTSAPLAVVGCGFGQGNAADVVSAHVLAMFAPSFVTGSIINRFGAMRVMATGLAILAVAGVVAVSGVELTHFFIALVLLGVGWNFGFIGATTLLTASHPAHERGRVQGMNDTIVFGAVTVASVASGVLMNWSGAPAADGWTAVNMAMVPFLALAGGALIWFAMRPKGSWR
ncbi:MAG: MFS transporter [Rubellimicrobium sp.]|nr:MFS transporter [Rubellimicrobium sp.]